MLFFTPSLGYNAPINFSTGLVAFINTTSWRAISITTIAMLIIILLVDGTAHSRIEAYHKDLKLIDRLTSDRSLN